MQKSLNSAKSSFTLGGLSFEINQGEVIALVGLNGAGKTTLLKLIMGLLVADTGEVVFNNTQLDFNRNKIGYFPESFFGINTNLKVECLMQLMAKLNNISFKDIDNKIEDVLKKVNMLKQSKKRFNLLSKGMKTRLGIAQALLGDPSLLIFDEPTDGLDPEGKREIKMLLQDLKQENKTILLSSHNLQEVESTCDRVIVLHKGLILKNFVLNDLPSIHISLENYFFQIIKEFE